MCVQQFWYCFREKADYRKTEAGEHAKFVFFLSLLSLSNLCYTITNDSFVNISFHFLHILASSQQMMGAVDKFLHKLESFDKENIPTKVIKALQPYLKVIYIQYSSRKYTLKCFIDYKTILISTFEL